MEQDQPVKPGEVGRLLITSKVRKGQKIERYEIGDIGRWIIDPCACGRTQARFELLGRMGDVFRIGATFLNYQSLLKSFASEMNYSSYFQIHLLPAEKLSKEKIIFKLDQSVLKQTDIEKIESSLMNVKDLRVAIKTDKTLEMNIELVDINDFEKSKGSGKIRSFVDHRLT